MGSMANYITHANPNYFQPMNANFGIMQLMEKVKKKDRKEAFARQALKAVSYTHLDVYKRQAFYRGYGS